MGLSSKWKSFKKLLKPTDKSDLQAKIATSLKESGEELGTVNESISALKSAFKERCGAGNIANMFLEKPSGIEEGINKLQETYKEVRSRLSKGVVDLVGKTGRSESKKCADAFIQTLSALEETLEAFEGQALTAGDDNSDVLVDPWQDTMKEIGKLNSAVKNVSDKRAALGGEAKVAAKALTEALQSQVENLKDIFVSVNEAVTAGKATMGTIEGDSGKGIIDSKKLDIFSPGSEKLLTKSVKSLAPIQLETSIDNWLKKLDAEEVDIAKMVAAVKDIPLQILHAVKKLLAAILGSGQLSLLSKSHLKTYVKKLGDVLAMQHAIMLRIARDGHAENCGSQLAKLEKLNIELKKLNAKLGSKVKSLRDAKIIMRLVDKSAALLSKVTALSSPKSESTQPEESKQEPHPDPQPAADLYADGLHSYDSMNIAEERGLSSEENSSARSTAEKKDSTDAQSQTDRNSTGTQTTSENNEPPKTNLPRNVHKNGSQHKRHRKNPDDSKKKKSSRIPSPPPPPTKMPKWIDKNGNLIDGWDKKEETHTHINNKSDSGTAHRGASTKKSIFGIRSSDSDSNSGQHDSGNHSDAPQQPQVSADDFVNNLINNDSAIEDLFNNVDNNDWINQFSGNGSDEFRTMCARLSALKRLGDKLPESRFRSEFIEMLYKYDDNDKDLLSDIFDFCWCNTPAGNRAGGPLVSFQALCNTYGSDFKNLKEALGTGTERFDTNLHWYKQFNGRSWDSLGRERPKSRPARLKKK